jgi:uncharacterized repeat protein (TIGR01451 family)
MGVATESPSPVPHGTNLTYTITIGNHGPDTTAIILKDVLPSDTTFVSAVPSTGSCSTPAPGGTGTLTCSVNSLAKASTFNVVLTIHDIAAAGATITDTAKVSASVPDPNTSNNQKTTNTSVD